MILPTPFKNDDRIICVFPVDSEGLYPLSVHIQQLLVIPEMFPAS